MRQIGHLPDELQARTFGDFLFVEGVDNQIEQDDGGWTVWIHSEEDLARGETLLNEFRAAPDNPRFRETAAGAKKLRARDEKERIAYAAKSASARPAMQVLRSNSFGLVPLILVVISAGVFLISQIPAAVHYRNDWLFITGFERTENLIRWLPGLPEIRHGQVWRLFTPMFIHFGFAHIFFNMLWLRDLGVMIETRQGSLRLLLLVLVIAAVSNYGQYLQGGPSFGGMSGVVFGLFGYVWMKAKITPWSGYILHPNIVVMQMIWLVVCFTGLIGPVANTCHLVGLGVGGAWGWLSTLKRS